MKSLVHAFGGVSLGEGLIDLNKTLTLVVVVLMNESEVKHRSILDGSSVLDSFNRFFFHGILYCGLMYLMSAWMSSDALLPSSFTVPAIIYLFIMVAAFVLMGALNWLLTGVIWDTNVRGGFHGHLSHGAVLTLVLGVLGLVQTVFFAYAMASPLTTAIILTVIGLFSFSLLYGFVARSVAYTLREDH
ncbi:MAG: hypothetical protein DRO87_04255 [Candidatus Thorarchaeota archaeon]|nr:MAG: hypothetical protein DRP09_09315 [Candidatus Thorarchaeota archaeon]RLI58976.1 MAG: hypothetical protein DRO87_04255 [Candidatus Thorarchaeota archaeon]